MLKSLDTVTRPLFAVATLTAALCACAQVPPPPPGPQAGPMAPGPVGAPPLPPTPAVAGVQRLEGTVKAYLVDEFGDVDGFVSQDDVAVRFPPHMSADLVRTLKPGDRFVAQGSAEAWGRFRAFSLGKRGSDVVLNESRPSIAPQPPLPPEARDARLAPMQADGTVATVLYAPRGEVEGLVLNDGTIVRVPPGTMVAARAGSRVQASGLGTRSAYGRGMRADTITVDGQTMAALPARGPARPAPQPPVAPGAPS